LIAARQRRAKSTQTAMLQTPAPAVRTVASSVCGASSTSRVSNDSAMTTTATSVIVTKARRALSYRIAVLMRRSSSPSVQRGLTRREVDGTACLGAAPDDEGGDDRGEYRHADDADRSDEGEVRLLARGATEDEQHRGPVQRAVPDHGGPDAAGDDPGPGQRRAEQGAERDEHQRRPGSQLWVVVTEQG